MNTQQLYTKFKQGIGWNAFLLIVNKTLYLSLSLLLYKSLISKDFSLWANINSTVFLLLLWLDCGFRKSLPRFAPEFAKNKKSMKKFVKRIFIFQLILLTTITPFFFFLLSYITKSFGQKTLYLSAIGASIFFIEGIVSILRLLYHSYFWQKQFNIMSSVIISAQTLTTLTLISIIKNSTKLIQAVFIVKLISGALIILGAFLMLKSLYKNKIYNKNEKVEEVKMLKAFVKHSFFMWINTTIKSLTERNTLIPIFTYTIGPASANIFKIANDGALFFQRIVIKTIGTADTSLLAHIETNSKNSTTLQQMFEKLIKNFISISVPLIVIIFVFSPKFFGTMYGNSAFKLFFILSTSYLIHAIFLPFERVLEVKKHYNTLLTAYIPYLFLLIFFVFFSNNLSYIGLIKVSIVVHFVRLTSVFLIFYFSKKSFYLKFPIKFTLLIFFITLIPSLLIIFIWQLITG